MRFAAVHEFVMLYRKHVQRKEKESRMSTTDRRLTDEEIRRIVASYPKPAKKVKPKAKATLTLAASRDLEPDEQVASVPLEPEDVAIVREALAGRNVRVGADDVSFDHVTNARVTMRWSSPMSPTSPPLVRDRVIDDFGHAVIAYDPYAKERMPGYRGDDE
jgi:hypothetical protein